MTQIGTESYNPEKFCPPVSHTISAMDVPEALSDYTDGYR